MTTTITDENTGTITIGEHTVRVPSGKSTSCAPRAAQSAVWAQICCALASMLVLTDI